MKRFGLIVSTFCTLTLLSNACESSEFSRVRDFGDWIDADGDCQNTRQEVLIRDSLIPVTLSSNKCSVTSGLWLCPYTGKVFTNPKELDIDHLVPLKEVYLSGAEEWSFERRKSYANDLTNKQTLLVTSKAANRSKGDKDPSKWMPSNIAYWNVYLVNWTKTKQQWEMSFDGYETNSIRQLMQKTTEMQKGIKIEMSKSNIVQLL